MVVETQLKDRQAWLENRQYSIGGSDAAAVIGLNPWMTNVELWEIKKGIKKQTDISAVPVVVYGTNAEYYLRELFILDFPEFDVGYDAYNLYRNTDYPWAHASLDGWLEDKQGRRGVLEIKTANIMSAVQWKKWQGKRFPDNYYAQVLHNMAVYEADFAIVKAQLKREKDGDVYLETKHYCIERSDVQEEIDYLMEAEKAFWESLQSDRRPNAILPEI